MLLFCFIKTISSVYGVCRFLFKEFTYILHYIIALQIVLTYVWTRTFTLYYKNLMLRLCVNITLKQFCRSQQITIILSAKIGQGDYIAVYNVMGLQRQ